MRRTFIPGLPFNRVIAKTSNRTSPVLARLGIFSPHTAQVADVRYDSQQKSAFSQDLSDHLLVKYSVTASKAYAAATARAPAGPEPKAPKASVMSWNMMMQANVSERGPNTAFAHIEDKKTYETRFKRILDATAELLRENPDIGIIAFQEAPVSKNDIAAFIQHLNQCFPEEWKTINPAVSYDSTRWGIFTLINHQRLQTTKPNLDESLTINLTATNMDVRCKTFAMYSTDTQSLLKYTNLHLPHIDAEIHCKQYMTNVIKDLIKHGLNADSLTHNLFGDWNIDAEHLNLLIKEIIIEQMKAAPAGTVFPFHISAELQVSQEGHLHISPKRSADSPYVHEKLSVDAALKLHIEPAQSYSYTFNYSPIDKSTVATAAMFASSVFIGAVAFDEANKPADIAQTTDEEEALQAWQQHERFNP